MGKIMKTMDGNEAAAYAAYAFTEVAGFILLHLVLLWLITPICGQLQVKIFWSSCKNRRNAK